MLLKIIYKLLKENFYDLQNKHNILDSVISWIRSQRESDFSFTESFAENVGTWLTVNEETSLARKYNRTDEFLRLRNISRKFYTQLSS